MQLAIRTDGVSIDATAILLVERFVEAIATQLGAPVRLIRISLRAVRGAKQARGDKRCNLNILLADRSRWRVSESSHDLIAAISQAFCELRQQSRHTAIRAARAARMAKHQKAQPQQ